MDNQQKQRIIQEFVPGKQITLAHIIANPVEELCEKLGMIDMDNEAIGVMTITPTEAVIIGADVASKAGGVSIAFVDRFNGSLVVCGDVDAVESSVDAVLDVLGNKMHFDTVPVTRT